MSVLEELKCKKCLARQRCMKFIKISKVNQATSKPSNKQIFQKWLKESVLGAGPTIG